MQEIKPTYVSFEQAQKLKEKKCNIKVYQYYRENKDDLVYLNIEESDGYINNWAYCYAAPEQWQAIEWLRLNHNLWIEVYRNGSGFGYIIQKADSGTTIREITDFNFFNIPQEAYSSAIDYVLNELI